MTSTCAHPSTEARSRHVASGKMEANAARVLGALTGHPNATAAELSWQLDMDTVEVRRRLSDLQNRGLAEHVSKRKCRVANTLAFEWRRVPKASEQLPLL